MKLAGKNLTKMTKKRNEKTKNAIKCINLVVVTDSCQPQILIIIFQKKSLKNLISVNIFVTMKKLQIICSYIIVWIVINTLILTLIKT